MFGDGAFSPSDFGMSNKSYDGSNGSSDEVREPDVIVVSNDKISDDDEDNVVKKSNANTNEKITNGVLAGFDVFLTGGVVFGMVFNALHVDYYNIWTNVRF